MEGFLKSVETQDYTVTRAGWIGDYNDPNTFMDMWVTDGPQQYRWSNARYDELIDWLRKGIRVNGKNSFMRRRKYWLRKCPCCRYIFM